MMKIVLAYILLSIILMLVPGGAQMIDYRLELEALPPAGRAPLTVSLVAEITGGLDTSPELYCKTQHWDFGDGREMRVLAGCGAWKPGRTIDRTLGQYQVYEEPGEYWARVSYGPLESNPIQIIVFEEY